MTKVVLKDGANIQDSSWLRFRKHMDYAISQSVPQAYKLFPRTARNKTVQVQIDSSMSNSVRNALKSYPSLLPNQHDLHQKSLSDYNSLYIQVLSNPDEELLKHDKAAILYIHGGGFFCGSSRTYEGLSVCLSARSGGVPVFSLDYPLAPEFRFPAQLESAVAAYQNLLERGYDTIGLVGDSAGGNLVLALTLKLKQLEISPPASVCALSPWTDLTHSGNSVEKNASIDPIIPSQLLHHTANLYVGNYQFLTDPFVSPLYACKEQLEDFPPLLIHVGENEVLLDDSLKFGEIVKAASQLNSVEVIMWSEMPHVFQVGIGLMKEADLSLDEIGKFFQRHLKAHLLRLK